MGKEIYKKTFFDKKIVVKNEIIYYFESRQLKEAISVVEFDKGVIERKYENKTGLGIILETIMSDDEIPNNHRYKKIVEYKKLKFLDGREIDVSRLNKFEFRNLKNFIESAKTERLILDEQKFHMKDDLINNWIWNYDSNKMSREKLQEKYDERIEDSEVRRNFLSDYEKKVFKIRKDELLESFKNNSNFINFLKIYFIEIFYYTLVLIIFVYVKLLSPVIVILIFFIIIINFFIKKNTIRKKLEAIIYSITFYQDRIVINTGDDVNRIKTEEIMSMAVDRASKHNLEFRISKKRTETRCNFSLSFTKMVDYELVKRERKTFLEILEEIPKWCVMNDIEFKIEK